MGAFPWMWVNGPDGKAIPGYLDEKYMIPALTWLRRAYAEGVLDPELTTERNATEVKFSQGIFGALNHVVGSYWYNNVAVTKFGASNPGLDPKKVVGVIAALAPRKGERQYHIPATDSCGTMFRDDLSNEKLERILLMDDWMLSTEGQLFINMGFEGVDYAKNTDGSYKKLHNEDLIVKYPSFRFKSFPAWAWDFEHYEDPSFSADLKQLGLDWQKKANAAAVDTGVNLIANMRSTPERKAFTFNYNAKLTEIITGKDSVEAMYQAFAAEAYANGVQKVIDSVNKAISK
jgi:hypothetical protein